MSGEQRSRPAVKIAGSNLRNAVGKLFEAAGLSYAAACEAAEALVEADLQGLPSHGVMQAETYLDRLKAGSVTTAHSGEIVHRKGAVAILDAGNMLGQFAARQATDIAIELSREHGVGAVAVRNSFHFGAAGRYAVKAAEAGCIGIVMSNSMPVMPAPGGAQPLTGTNPLAIAIPTVDAPYIVLDMATTEGSIGKIRMAENAGEPLPAGWAVDEHGNATTDPATALKGMLLPAAGPKGFGLSLVIDLLCGLLADGGWGNAVGGMRRDMHKPLNASNLVIALDIGHFRPLAAFLAEATAGAARVRNSKRAEGTASITVPGERKWETARRNADTVAVPLSQVALLARLARDAGIELPAPFCADG